MPTRSQTAAACAVLGVFATAAACTDSTGPQCGNSVGDDGPVETSSAVINVNIVSGQCPKISGITAMPYDVDVGGTSAVTVTLTPSDAGIPTLKWSAPSGGFAAPNAAVTTFQCAVPGIVLLTFEVTLGGCRDSSTVPVNCRAPAP